MKSTTLFLPAVFAALMTTAALGQPAPTDAKILHDASAVLETEKAFRGLLIVPSVSHGVVTLTGTVSSEGDKVLASVEVGRIDGVKTVALVQIGEFGRVHWSFGELRARGEQVEQDRRVVSRAALRP